MNMLWDQSALCTVTVCPAIEKTLSVETLVSGMQRRPSVSLARRGQTYSCAFHQLGGSSARASGVTSGFCPPPPQIWQTMILVLLKHHV